MYCAWEDVLATRECKGAHLPQHRRPRSSLLRPTPLHRAAVAAPSALRAAQPVHSIKSSTGQKMSQKVGGVPLGLGNKLSYCLNTRPGSLGVLGLRV